MIDSKESSTALTLESASLSGFLVRFAWICDELESLSRNVN